MALPEPALRPGSAAEPESERIYAPSGRHLTGAAANTRKAYDRKIARVDESVAGMRSLAATMLDVLGIDQLRNRVGRERALDLIRFASGPEAAERIAGNWSQEDPGPRQLSTAAPGTGQQDFAGDPLHDERVTRAITVDRLDPQQVAAIIRTVTAEYRDAAAARERRRKELDGPPNLQRGPIGSPAMQPAHVTGGNAPKGTRWDPIAHVMVTPGGPGGPEANDPWSAYPDHSPEFLARQGWQSPSLGTGQMTLPDLSTPIPAAPEIAAPAPEQPCQHLAVPSSAKHCTECGAPLAPSGYWSGGPGEAAGQEPAPIDTPTAPTAPEAPSA